MTTLGLFPDKLQGVFWVLALASYVFAAVSGFFGEGEQRKLSIAFIALGLFLWHFPAMWDQLESAF